MACCSCLLWLASSKSLFSSSSSILVSIVNSQADPPILENLDFASAGARILKNHHFPFKDGFESALWLSWAPFGGSLGLFRASGSTTGGFQIPLRSLLGLGCSPESLTKLPFGVLRAFWGRDWLVFGASEGLIGSFLVLPRAFKGVFWHTSNSF